jgi:hypothetical protein
VNAGASPSRNALYSATVSDPNAALWASITPPSDSSLSTKVRRGVSAFSPDLLAHRLRLAFPGIFASHGMAFYAVLAGAMALGASVGLIGFAAADALRAQSSTSVAAASSAEPAARRVVRETPSLRPAVAEVSARPSVTVPDSASPPVQTLTMTSPGGIDDAVDSPAPAPRAQRRHHRLTKQKAKRTRAGKKHTPWRATRSRTRNEKARALARALGN